jgi:hypothetical protein
VKAGAARGKRALVAGSAQVEERRLAGYRMSSVSAQRCCDGGRECSAAWMGAGAVMGGCATADGGRGVVGLGRRMEVARRRRRERMPASVLLAIHEH